MSSGWSQQVTCHITDVSEAGFFFFSWLISIFVRATLLLELCKIYTHMICIYFSNDFFYCFVISHFIFLQSFFQLIYCYVSVQKDLNSEKIRWEQSRFAEEIQSKLKWIYPLWSLSKYSKALRMWSSFSNLFKCIVADINSA